MEQQVPVEVKENFGYVTSILHYMDDAELEPEYTREMMDKHPRYGLGFNINVRKKAWAALQWIVDHPEIDYIQLDSWNIRDSQVYFQRMKKLHELMRTFKFYEDRNHE